VTEPLTLSSMFKEKLRPSDYFMIIANLLPIVGVWFFGWDPYEIFIVYCLETIIIGFFTLVKLAIVSIVRKGDEWYNAGKTTRQPGIMFMLFFTAHYGMFVAIQMGLFFAASGMGKENNISLFNFFLKWPSLLTTDSLILLAVFFVSYLVKLITEFILTKEYKTVSMMKLMFQPYGRILIQQFTVILGGMFLSFGAGKIFITIFALIKLWFDSLFDFQKILNKGMEDLEKRSGEQ
jgi:hypothetical protein